MDTRPEQSGQRSAGSSLASLFERVASAVERGQGSLAKKLADSARRFVPADPTAILLQSQLMLEVGAAREALETLRGRDDAQSLVLQTDAACKAGMEREAAMLGQALLARFAVGSIAGMAEVAARVCGHYASRYPGWVGVDSSLRLVGELPPGSVATIHHADAAVGEIIAPPASSPRTGFIETLPPGRSGPVTVRVGGRDLLGSGLAWPPDFRASGWVVMEGRTLAGEVCLDWAPNSPVRLVIAHEGGESEFTVEPTSRGALGWPFSLPLEPNLDDQSRVHVAILLPDGTRAALAGSPLPMRDTTPEQVLAAPQRRTAAAQSSRGSTPDQNFGVHIVIPVYAGLEETLRCVRSVLATTPPALATVTVIDDASPDDALRAALDALAAEGRITLLRNPVNLGFPGTANRGMRLHADRDVVLLNSDTEVFEGWLPRLRAAAYSADDIGTVTPLGEAAAIVSYPRSGRVPASAADAADLDAIAAEVNAGATVDIPVGVGFCLYLRRQCLNEVGELDALGFGKGYGEENDFCLRARRQGWRHVAATSLFVRHVGGRSYGREGQVLRTRNARVIEYRHPGYGGLIADFIAADPLRPRRRAIDRQRLLKAARAPVLLVTHELPGGVRRHVEERRAALQALEYTVIVMHATSAGHASAGTAPAANSVPQVLLQVAGMELDDLRFDLPTELDELSALLRDLRLVRTELHHFLGLPGPVLDVLEGLPAPYQVFIHDYAWICPRVTLLGRSGGYCGEPAIEHCEECVAQNGSALGEPLTVRELRERSARLLAGAQRVAAPTEDVRRRMERYFPGIPIEVMPWQAPVRAARRWTRRRPSDPVRVALMGAIGFSKGYAILLDCARDAAARNLPLEFTVIGYSRDDAALLDTGRVFITGPYTEDEAPALIERERCDIMFFPSPGPETWCYTLTYALATGLRVAGFDIGAVGERLRVAETGLLVPPDTPAGRINDLLIENAGGVEIAPASQKNEEQLMSSNVAAAGADSAEIGATAKLITLPVGVYAFTVTRGGAPGNNGLALPALHVAPAPMRSEGTIEFLGGPATVDRWLTRCGDLVLAKISQGRVALVLTSLQSPSSEALAIDVRRIDEAEKPETAEPAAAADPSANPLRPTVLVHVQNVGDLEFSEGWAGRIADNFWIEAFSATLPDPPFPDVLEYQSVNFMDQESPWLSGGALCGSRGTGIPLVAFAIRPNEAAGSGYSVTYSGRFMSGSVVGPVRDGEMCRSTVPRDPLVAIDLTIEKRAPDA